MRESSTTTDKMPAEYALTNARLFLGDGLRDGLAVHVRGYVGEGVGLLHL